MDCPSCTFANSPMMRACVRCGSRLDFSGVAIDPPRRGWMASRSRLALIWRRRWGMVGRGVLSAGRVLRDQVSPDTDNRALALSIVPGLGHLHIGRRWVGGAIMGAWALLLVGSLAMVASETGWWLYLGLVALHANVMAVMLSRVMQHRPMVQRAFAGAGIYLGLHLLVYMPAWLVITRFVQPFPVLGVLAQEPVRSGDTLLIYGPALAPAAPARGDIVIFQAANGGHLIDRVLALPGEQLAVRDGRVYVNGEEVASGAGPIGRIRGWPEFAIEVGPHEVGVAPTTLRIGYADPRVNAEPYLRRALEANARVEVRRVEGVVFARLRPWGRAGFLQGDAP